MLAMDCAGRMSIPDTQMYVFREYQENIFYVSLFCLSLQNDTEMPIHNCPTQIRGKSLDRAGILNCG